MSGLLILAGFLVTLSYVPLGIEPMTEVYFEDHSSLPKYIFLNKDYNFSFVIVNLEHQDVEYDYIIEVFNEKGELVSELDKGEVTLSHNQSLLTAEDFSMNESFGRAKIQVTVIKKRVGEPEFKKGFWWEDPNYSEEVRIHFWVEEIVPTTITITDD